MPKKTLKEKIRSEVRKEQTALFSFRASTSLKQPILNAYSVTYVRGDILKTVYIGSAFILTEIVLYSLSGRFGW